MLKYLLAVLEIVIVTQTLLAAYTNATKEEYTMVLSDVALPVMIRTRIEREGGMMLYIPEIFGHWNPYVERDINWYMYEAIRKLADQQYVEQDAEHFSEMIGTFEVKTNERNVLSVAFSNYAYADGFAHGLTLMDSLTFDVVTGKHYKLAELFTSDSNYIERLTKIVNKQVKERDIPVFEEHVLVAKNQSFYIADKSLVLYYPLYAITPYYYGLPTFPISVYELESIVDEEGPLGRML